MKKGLFSRLKDGLKKTRGNFTTKINQLVQYYKEIDDDFFDELEETLILADIGVNTSIELVEKIRDRVKDEKIGDAVVIKDWLKEEITKILTKNNKPLELPSPSVMLVIGVNGVGKTTTIGKMALKYKNEGKDVLLAAGDTFRAAATEQLMIWGERAGVRVIHHKEGADPSAVIFDAITAAKAHNSDLLMCDTAGRLHNKKNLMNELSKINRIIEREYGNAKKEVLLVLDATTGQNAVSQAKLFQDTAGVTGLILTKLDGTAKGGVIVSICSELNIPVLYIGVGEGIDDLQEFSAGDFADALFSEG